MSFLYLFRFPLYFSTDTSKVSLHWERYLVLLSSLIRTKLSIFFLHLPFSCMCNQYQHMNDRLCVSLETFLISRPSYLPPSLSSSGFQQHTEQLRLSTCLLSKLCFFAFSFEANVTLAICRNSLPLSFLSYHYF